MDKNGLYGLGPVSYLKDEIVINDGTTYVSKVVTDSTMSVEKNTSVTAPFFVYANVKTWDTIVLPKSVRTIKGLETFIDA